MWNNSNSGVNPNATTVSYYNKGSVLGLLARRQNSARDGGPEKLRRRDAARVQRYGGDRGFTPDEFRATAEEIAAVDLREWFRKSVSSVEELDYADLLEWSRAAIHDRGRISRELENRSACGCHGRAEPQPEGMVDGALNQELKTWSGEP